MVPNQVNMDSGQPRPKPQSHTAAIGNHRLDVQEHCPGETGLSALISFPGHFEMSHSTIFQSPDLLISGSKQCIVSKIQERLNLMHAQFHCSGRAQLLLGQHLNISAHLRIYNRYLCIENIK